MLKPFRIVVAAVFVAGCGGQKHVPPANAARQALEASLSAWRDGKEVGTQEAAKPSIQAEDADWRAKKKLRSFEIGEEEPAKPDAPRRFKVKLALEGGAPTDAVFVVFGIDPVHVYRDRDFEKHFSGM
jgi:hypothetical protein